MHFRGACSLRDGVYPLTDAEFAATFQARVYPALQVDGYRCVAPLHFGRLVGDVLQLLVVHFTPERLELFVEHTSMLVVEPHGFANFDLGGRTPARGAFVASKSAVSQAVDAWLMEYFTTLRPRLEAAAALAGLMDVALHALGQSGSPHLWFTLAVGHARLGREKQARGFAQEALARYRAHCERSADGSPSLSAAWAQKGEQRVELLLDALYSGRVGPLLDGWRTGTLAALGLATLET